MCDIMFRSKSENPYFNIKGGLTILLILKNLDICTDIVYYIYKFYYNLYIKKDYTTIDGSLPDEFSRIKISNISGTTDLFMKLPKINYHMIIRLYKPDYQFYSNNRLDYSDIKNNCLMDRSNSFHRYQNDCKNQLISEKFRIYSAPFDTNSFTTNIKYIKNKMSTEFPYYHICNIYLLFFNSDNNNQVDTYIIFKDDYTTRIQKDLLKLPKKPSPSRFIYIVECQKLISF